MLFDFDQFLKNSIEQDIDLHPDYLVRIKRDDLIHSVVSGNKWRKLKYNILKAQQSGCDTVLTFGGAFSNHIVATAKAANLAGLNSIGIIRGEYADVNNSTLKIASSCGMKLILVPIAEYDQRYNYNYHDQLKLEYPFAHIIPEGGANLEGVSGVMEVTKELQNNYDYICCAVGTGTTAAGLILSKPNNTKIICFNTFKSAVGIENMINQQINLILNQQESLIDYKDDFMVVDGFSFGGYAKVNDALKQFARTIFKQHQLPLDLVYTAKAFYGLTTLLNEQKLKKGSSVLFCHSGGLQGNSGFDFVLE